MAVAICFFRELEVKDVDASFHHYSEDDGWYAGVGLTSDLDLVDRPPRSDIADRILRCSMIFDRWMTCSPKLAAVMPSWVSEIQSHVEYLKANKIRVAVFGTASPHHVESTLLSIACEFAQVRQIYLVEEAISGMLLPVETTLTPTFSRRLVKWEGGLDVSDSDVADFVSGKASLVGTTSNKVLKFRCMALTAALIINLKNGSKTITPGRPAHNLLDAIAQTSRQKRFMKTYDRLAIKDTFYLSRKLEGWEVVPIIFAHYHPEATTIPEGGRWYSDLEVIAEIRNFGYSGPIFYKEHPVTMRYWEDIAGVSKSGGYKDESFLHQLLELDVTLISINTPPQLLLSKHRNLFAVTIAGSVAFESLKIKKPVFCLGFPWYRGMKNLLDFENLVACLEAQRPPLWLPADLALELKTCVGSAGIINNLKLANRISRNGTPNFSLFLKFVGKWSTE